MSSDLSPKIAALRQRARIMAAIRAFFDRRDYLSVETPQLCRTPIPEAHIELFETRRAHHAHRATDSDASLWLLPSPEYYLKHLVAAGSGNLYEITHSFRNGEEIGRYHDIEFTMLEYYTVDAGSEDSLTITTALLQALGETTVPVTLTMHETWNRFVGIELAATMRGPEAGGSDPIPDRRALAEAIHLAGLSLTISPEETWEDLFQRVFLTYIEPELPRTQPVFITDYPAAVSTLAQTRPGTPWADRWELYLGGVEVANCFGEETDPGRISEFFTRQQRRKSLLGHPVPPVDGAYLHSPRLPRCSGVALGVDRLVMHLLEVDDMGDVVSFRP